MTVTMGLLSFCVIVVLLIVRMAAASLVNSYGTSQCQKPTKVRHVALPITVLAVVCALAIAVLVYLWWFVTAETLAIALFLSISLLEAARVYGAFS